jgi:hypothetical protein
VSGAGQGEVAKRAELAEIVAFVAASTISSFRKRELS